MSEKRYQAPDYRPSEPNLKKWAHERGSVYIGDQKQKVSRPRLRDVEAGKEVPLQSYQAMHQHGQFSEELLMKILSGVSEQKYSETVLETASAFGVSSSTVSRKIVEATAKKLTEFQERDLSDFASFAIFIDGINRGGDTFLVALGLDKQGSKKPLGFWQGTTENHDICEELLKSLENRGLKLSKRGALGNRWRKWRYQSIEVTLR